MKKSVTADRQRRLVLALIVSAIVLAFILSSSSRVIPRAKAVSSGIVISQVYGGGGNSGSTFKNDFIELFNRSASPVDVTGWSVQYTSAAATGVWQVTPLSSFTIQPGQYYLIQESQGAGGTTNLPTPDATGTILMSATAANVALVSGTTALATGCPAAGSVVDKVAYGSGACPETTAVGTLSNTTAAIRSTNGCSESDNNSADFSIGAPTPRNSASATNSCSASGALSASGSASPSGPLPGDTTLLTVTVVPATGPPSTGITVSGDLTSIGGSATQTFYDDGTHGDTTPGNNVFSFQTEVSPNTTTGSKTIPISVADAQLRTATTNISLSVTSPTCGVERWSVKVGTDPDANLVNINNATPVTIATMRSWTAPPTPPDNARVQPYETTAWLINGTLTVYKKETDVDYHVVVQDGAGNTVITEIPCACCAVGSPFQSLIEAARQTFDGRLTATTSFQTANIPVRIKGVGFFDFLHGQTGVAPNGIELHSILDISFPTQQAAPTSSGTNVNTQVGDANINFSSVSSGGTTTVMPIDPSSAGSAPAGGYSLVGPGYDISTTATLSGPVSICFSEPSITDPVAFSKLRVLHSEGGNLIDRTSGVNFVNKLVCASNVPSLSPFVIAVGSAPTAAAANITGRILTADGLALGGVTVTLSGTQRAITITDANGVYSFTALETGGFYTVSATRANYNFSPAQWSFSLLGNSAEAAFTGILATPTTSPLETAEFFVRQQYLDFLGREPDHQGLEFWSYQLRQCNADAPCLNQRRIDISAAFFEAQEFQDTGFFAYRVYKAALGQRPSYAELTAARGFILDGEYKEVNKANFVDHFVTRADFQARYPLTLTNEAFVDQLLNSAELYFAPADRQRFINDLQSGETRADVLRELIEVPAFKTREYNRAFVLMQYFGYLQRDADPTGYEFWLSVMNSGSNNYASMVCAFITSAEYQLRFSPITMHSNRECGSVTSSVLGYHDKAPVTANEDADEDEKFISGKWSM